MIDFSPRRKKSLFAIITTLTYILLLIFTGKHVPSITKSDMAGLQATTSAMVVGHVPARSSLVLHSLVYSFFSSRPFLCV
jgi:hypothetical protein